MPSPLAKTLAANEVRDGLQSDVHFETDQLGAVCIGALTRFRVWAPRSKEVRVVLESPTSGVHVLEPEGSGYFSADVAVSAGTLYKYRLDGAESHPDPCSRFQPSGPHGASLVVEPGAFGWTDADWRGVRLKGQVIYELHVGAFTPEGTLDAASSKLSYLQDLGVTLIELLPVAECPGRWNWGYDGVQLFAPYHRYGDPEALKRFVDAAHSRGMAVILDVVYNHLGPDGNYLKHYAPDYFSRKYITDWGEALNFDAEGCRGARDFITGNARYWINEFHLDGLRLDATQSLFDSSELHIIADLTRHARRAANGRSIVVVAENEPQHSEHLNPIAKGGYDLDGLWNDDFHHAARVALTGSRDGYFHDYTGRAQEFVSTVRRGFLYQGQRYDWQKKPRGSPLAAANAGKCIHYLQNHDQVGNSCLGDRVHGFSAPARFRALTALLLLSPQTPMLFMGQEFLASTRFSFFADHQGGLRTSAWAGRREFLRQFRAYADEAVQAAIPDPAAEATFLASKLDWSEAERNSQALALHRDLLHLRRNDPVIARLDCAAIEGATVSEHAFVLRWADATHGDRLLVVNLDQELLLTPAPEPLLAPSANARWHLQWSSNDVRYNGQGVAHPVDDEQRWRIPANSATLLSAVPVPTTP